MPWRTEVGHSPQGARLSIVRWVDLQNCSSFFLFFFLFSSIVLSSLRTTISIIL